MCRYHQTKVSLPLYDKQNITICTFFRSNIMVPKEITLFGGNDTFKGFFRALNAALAHKDHDIVHVHGQRNEKYER